MALEMTRGGGNKFLLDKIYVARMFCKNIATAQWRKQGIREIKVCKKCPKVNPYCDAICDPILIKPFLDGAK